MQLVNVIVVRGFESADGGDIGVRYISRVTLVVEGVGDPPHVLDGATQGWIQQCAP